MDSIAASKTKKVTYQDAYDENNDYLEPLNDKPILLSSHRTKSSEKSNKSQVGCFGSINLLISLILYVGVPISQFVIGIIYTGQCTIQPFLPVYMILSGVFGIAFCAVGLIIFIEANKKSSTLYGSSGSNRTLLRVLVPIFVLLFLSVFGWFITGQVLVFQIKTHVELIESALPEYCHANLYKAAYILIFVDYIIILFATVLNSLNFVSSSNQPDKNKNPKRPIHPAKK